MQLLPWVQSSFIWRVKIFTFVPRTSYTVFVLFSNCMKYKHKSGLYSLVPQPSHNSCRKKLWGRPERNALMSATVVTAILPETSLYGWVWLHCKVKFLSSILHNRLKKLISEWTRWKCTSQWCWASSDRDGISWLGTLWEDRTLADIAWCFLPGLPWDFSRGNLGMRLATCGPENEAANTFAHAHITHTCTQFFAAKRINRIKSEDSKWLA